MSELHLRRSQSPVPWRLQGVDVQGELTAARASIEQLGKQVALLGRDQEVRPGRHRPLYCFWQGQGTSPACRCNGGLFAHMVTALIAGT